MATELDRLAKQNLDLLEFGNFADAEIVCNGTTWKVHKLILRSRCPWFDKAFSNNWKEAQTGRIQLEDEKPEQISELLKFIYIGRYIPAVSTGTGCIKNAVLAKNVSLWRTAEFFLLADLKAAIQTYLISRFASVLSFFNNFRVSLVTHQAVHNKEVDNQDYLNSFFADFSEAVTIIYKSPCARELHRLFAASTCGIREHLPAQVLWDLMKRVPEFQQDVSTALIAIHFPKVTDKPVSGGAQSFFVSEIMKAQKAWSTDPSIIFKCSECGKQCPKAGKATSSGGEGYDVVLDPFPLGTRKWCSDCYAPSIRSLLKTLIRDWPADAPGLG